MAKKEKQQPYGPGIDAERAILGAVLLDNSAYYEASELSVEDFRMDSHQKIWLRMIGLQESGKAVDIVTLSEELSRRGEVDSIGGIAYLAGLTDGLPRRPSIANYVRIVQEKSRLRGITSICALAANRATEEEESGEIIADTESALQNLVNSQKQVSSCELKDLTKPVLQEIIRDRDRKPEEAVLEYGLGMLDEMTGGIHADELITVAARTNQGKTFFALQVARHNAQRGLPVDVYALEMRKEKLVRRMLADMTGIGSYKLRKPRWLTVQDLDKIGYALEEMSAWPLRIYDRRDLGRKITGQQLASRIKMNIAQHGTRLTVIDYLQLLQASEDGKLVTDNYRRVSLLSEIFATLKTTTGVPIIQLSQLSRPKDEKEREGPPNLYSLKQSGEIENDTDTAILLWMEHKKKVWTGKDAIIVAKQREGPTDTVAAHFDRDRLMWEERAVEVPEDKPPKQQQPRDSKAAAAQDF